MVICCLLLASRMNLHVFEDKVMESFSSRLGNKLQCLNFVCWREDKGTDLMHWQCTAGSDFLYRIHSLFWMQKQPSFYCSIFFCSGSCIYEPADIKCFAILLCFQQAIGWNNRTYYDSGWKWSINDFMHQVWGKKTKCNIVFLIIMQLESTYRFIYFLVRKCIFAFFLIRLIP